MPDIMNTRPMTTAQKRMKERLCKENPALAHKLDFKLNLTYCVLIYCLLGCSPSFNQFARSCKQFITNEWRNDYV